MLAPLNGELLVMGPTKYPTKKAMKKPSVKINDSVIHQVYKCVDRTPNVISASRLVSNKTALLLHVHTFDLKY